MAKRQKRHNNCLSDRERIEHKRQVKGVLKVVGRSLSALWHQHKKAKHEIFVNECSRYLKLQLNPVKIEQAHLPTTDDAIIHTPVAKSIDQAIQRQVNQLKQEKRYLKALSEVKALCLKVSIKPFQGIDLDNHIVRVIRIIWGETEITYNYDDRKKNAQMYCYIISLLGASIAYLAGIDDQYPISEEVKIPIQKRHGWLSPAAVSMGMDCFRCSQSENPFSQMGLLFDCNLADYIEHDSDRMGNTAARYVMAFMQKDKSIISENYILTVERKSDSELEIKNLYHTDKNGFGHMQPCEKISSLDLAATMLRRFGHHIIDNRSFTHKSQNENALCNIRMLSTGKGKHHEMKISFMGIYDKNAFDVKTVGHVSRQEMLHKQLMYH